MRSPISARRTVIPSVLKVPPETEDLKENTLTRVESLLTTILAILQSDESNKQSDTNRYCMFQVHWDRIENCLTHIGQR